MCGREREDLRRIGVLAKLHLIAMCVCLVVCSSGAAADRIAKAEREAIFGVRAHRPLLVVYSTAGCDPCARLLVDSKAADFPFRVEVRPTPAWIHEKGEGFPAIQYQGANGQWHVAYGWSGLDDFMKLYLAANPPRAPQSIPATQKVTITASVDATGIIEHMREFAGDSGTIDIDPGREVVAKLAGGDTVTYRRLAVRYSVAEDKAVFRVDPPYPVAQVTFLKRLHVSADIHAVEIDETGDAAVSTSKGRYRFRLEAIK